MFILKSMIVGFISSMAAAGFVDLFSINNPVASLCFRIIVILCVIGFLYYWRYSK